MVYETYIYCAENTLISNADQETTQRITEAISKIQSFYNAGTPLFTKDAIRHVHQQLVQCKGQEVSVIGLDRIKVRFRMPDATLTRPGNSSDTELVLGAPFINYFGIQQLTSPSINYVPHTAYCSLRVYHYLEPQFKSTKERIPIAPMQTYGEAQEFFKSRQAIWRESSTYNQLKATLQSKEILPEIRKIIAFACAPFSYGHQEGWADRPAIQHAMLLTLRDILMERNKGSIECFAQDPAYTEIDRLVLKDLGVKVLDDPLGFLEVDDSTLVVSICAALPVKQIISEIARPGIMIWDKVCHEEPQFTPQDSDSLRVRELTKNFYEEFEFPNDKENFNGLCIYVRQV